MYRARERIASLTPNTGKRHPPHSSKIYDLFLMINYSDNALRSGWKKPISNGQHVDPFTFTPYFPINLMMNNGDSLVLQLVSDLLKIKCEDSEKFIPLTIQDKAFITLPKTPLSQFRGISLSDFLCHSSESEISGVCTGTGLQRKP